MIICKKVLTIACSFEDTSGIEETMTAMKWSPSLDQYKPPEDKLIYLLESFDINFLFSYIDVYA